MRRRNATIFTWLVNFCWSLFQWCLLLAVAAALLVGGYLYFRIDDEIRRQAERLLASHYEDLEVRVGGARFDQDRGVAIYDVTLREHSRDRQETPLLAIDEMYLAGTLGVEELLTGAMHIERVTIRRATLHAIRHTDGRWNAGALLPLPRFSDESPVIAIEDLTLQLDQASPGQDLPSTLHGIHLTLTPAVTNRAVGDAARSFHVAGVAVGLPARELRLEGQIDIDRGELDLSVSMAGLELSSDLLLMLPGASAGQLEGVDVTGRADVTVEITRAAAEQPLKWSAALAVDRGRLVHGMLPAPLSDFTVTGHANAESLHIERLEGKCGPASVVLAAERSGWAADAPLAVAAKVVGLPLDNRVRDVLPEPCARLWRRFLPAGIVDAELRLVFDGRRWLPQVEIACRGISLTDADKFPYRLEHVTGKLQYRPAESDDPDSLQIDLTGVGGGQPVRIEAQLQRLAMAAQDSAGGEPASGRGLAVGYRGGAPQHAPQAAGHPVGWLEISGTDIPLHEQLIAALRPEKIERLIRSLEPQGLIDFRFRAEWNDPTPAEAEVTQEIRLKRCALRYAEFPYPLRDVQGLVTQRDGRWQIHDITARGATDTTVVTCRGMALPNADAWHVEIALEAENLPLDESLKQALPPASQRIWDELRPRGRIDCTVTARHDTYQREPAIELTLTPRNGSVSIEPVTFPYRLEQIEGVATYGAGRLEVRNLQARHGRSIYSASEGGFRIRADGGWQMELGGIHAERLSLGRELTAALPPRVQKVLQRFQPTGVFSLYRGNLSLVQGGPADRVAAAWDVTLDCHRAAVGGELPLQSVTGEIRLVGRSDGQSTYTAGELALDSLIWKDLQLTNVRGPMWLDGSHCYLGEPAAQRLQQANRRVTADAYGGTIAANAELQYAGTPSYTLDLALGGASLARFANERMGGPKDVSGTASGRLVLSGTGRSTQTLSGRGELHVVDANIYKLPVLVAMLKVLRNRTPDTTAFHRCDMHFTIQGEHVYFQQLNLLGDAVNLYGKGESDFDRRLDLVFYTLIEPAMPIPFVRSVARQVSKQTLQLKVVGTWDEAEVQPQTLPGVNHVLEQIQAGAATIAPAAAARDTTTSPR